MRINKFLSAAGYCARRQADRLVEAGRVTINGQVATVGDRVAQTDLVMVDHQQVSLSDSSIYLLLNKPIGVECTLAPNVHPNLCDVIDYPERLYPIGRLDKASHGLLIMTNDGDFANRLMRADDRHRKVYRVRVREFIQTHQLEQLERGVEILGKRTNPCSVKSLGDHRFEIILNQGMNRQIRRMCEVVGLTVIDLKRIEINGIKLRHLPEGAWRMLEPDEIDRLKASISD